MIFTFLFLACGEKETIDTSAEDTAVIENEPSNPDSGDPGTDTDTGTEDTGSAPDTGEEPQDSGEIEEPDTGESNEEIEPSNGSWLVTGPEFITDTCGGGGSYPDPRTMTLSSDSSSLTISIDDPDEGAMNFFCTRTEATFSCEPLVYENEIPFLPCTLYYTHQLDGAFTDSNIIEGTYTIFTTTDGASGCTEEDLAFSPPCEQSGPVMAIFEE